MMANRKPSAAALRSLAELKEVYGRCVDAGICPGCRCRLAAEDRVHCRVCIRRRSAAYRVRVRHRLRLTRCSICRRPGHNRQTCRSKKAANYWSDSASGPGVKKAVAQ